MEFSEVIKQRYACKKFDGRPVETEQLNAILEAGRLAPTAKNLQDSGFMLYSQRKDWEKSTKQLRAVTEHRRLWL